MNNIGKEQKAKLGIAIALIKVAIIIFVGEAVIGLLPYTVGDIDNIQLRIAVVLCIISVAWWQWIYTSRELRLWEQPRLSDYVELVSVVIAVTWIVYIGGFERSAFKFLYGFIIMTNAFRFNMRYGLVSACLSSTGVIFCDMAWANVQQRDIYLEGDLLLLISFFLLAFIMGYLALCQKENIERITLMADRDGLTGLYNGRTFHERLLSIIERAIDEKCYYNVWVVFLDIADFEKYNEVYGYAMGNTVIAQIADIISSEAGDAELISRYDGDKYGLIFINRDLKDIKDTIANIKSNVERYPFYGKNVMPGGVITIHAGVAGYPIDGLTKEQIIKSANRDMDAVRLMYNKTREVNLNQTEVMSTVQVFINIINNNDHYTYEHIQRVVMYADLLAKALNLSPHSVVDVQCGAYLHDIGKIEVPPNILNKSGPLTSEEVDILEKHTLWGADIVQSIKTLAHIAPIIKYHHERWDGKGYPEGIGGKNIPLEARIVALADGFDMMVTGRWPDEQKYNSINEAIQGLIEHAGTYFDPELVDVFIKAIQSDELLMRKLG